MGDRIIALPVGVGKHVAAQFGTGTKVCVKNSNDFLHPNSLAAPKVWRGGT